MQIIDIQPLSALGKAFVASQAAAPIRWLVGFTFLKAENWSVTSFRESYR